MKVEVTQADIEEAKLHLNRPGTFNDKFWDPIAMALRRVMKASRVIVHPYTAEINGAFFSISKEAQDLGRDWGNGKPVTPITFTIVSIPAQQNLKPRDLVK